MGALTYGVLTTYGAGATGALLYAMGVLPVLGKAGGKAGGKAVVEKGAVLETG
jgi:hypothetical protein